MKSLTFAELLKELSEIKYWNEDFEFGISGFKTNVKSVSFDKESKTITLEVDNA